MRGSPVVSSDLWPLRDPFARRPATVWTCSVAPRETRPRDRFVRLGSSRCWLHARPEIPRAAAIPVARPADGRAATAAHSADPAARTPGRAAWRAMDPTAARRQGGLQQAPAAV